MSKKKNNNSNFKYPGERSAVDGNTAVILCERESSDAAGAYPITPSTQMGEYWSEAAASGHLNISGRPLIFIEPEGEHAAAAVTAGLSMTGLRAANFSSGQGIAYMHESLYAAVGKRLTYVLNVGARAMTKATLNVHAGHDDYHAVDDTGFFQLFAKNAQQAADFNLIAHRVAELALNPGIVAQDGFLTTHLIESMMVPERELIEEYLGRPDDIIATPTPAQRILYGDQRRRIPELWDVDNPVMSGVVQNQDAYMQSVAAQRPFFFDHIAELTDQAMDEFYRLTGRRYERVMTYRVDDAEYLILGQGSVLPSAEAVVDYLRSERKLRVGVVELAMFRPFPSDLLSRALEGRKGVAVLERLDQPLAADLPLMREVRSTVSKALENGFAGPVGKRRLGRRSQEAKELPYPELASYQGPGDAPALYSGSFGLGSRDLQPEGLLAAIENMLPDGAHRKHFYLSIDFLHEQAKTPKQEIYQQTIEESYRHVRELAIKGSENPNLMPEGSTTVRIHSVGGWGAITTGKNLAMTLFDLLGYHIKANPKYGSEKKGQPTTYYLSAAPEPIRVNCEYFHVDVVLSPDPNVFHHSNAIAGLRRGGVFVIQSDLGSPEAVWHSIPTGFRKVVEDKEIRLYYLDAFQIARDEATDPDLQLRMQGNAFQGAFFRASDVMEHEGLDEGHLLQAIEAQLQKKFGSKGARVVADNVRVVKRGFEELKPVPYDSIEEVAAPVNGNGSGPQLPVMLESVPQGQAPITDVHRFWEQTGSFYVRGQGSDNLTDPFIGLGVIPAVSALFRDMTGIRFEHPQWIPENCTACGDCYTVCPDTAIPGLVNEVGEVIDTVVKRVRNQGHEVEHLPKASRIVERHLRGLFQQAEETDSVSAMMDGAITAALDEMTGNGSSGNGVERTVLERELDWFREELGDFQFALSRPYFTVPEQRQAGDGGLLSITVNPYTCKGCMECVEVCDDDALHRVTQTDDSIETLRQHWDFWLDLPTTPQKYIRVDDIDEAIGALETILLDKNNYLSLTSGDGACLGCGEKTVIHLFTATVEALMQPRVKKHTAYLHDLIERLEQHVRLQLVGGLDVSDASDIAGFTAAHQDEDLTLADLAEHAAGREGAQPIDQEWLRRTTGLVAKLKNLLWRYERGASGKGRTSMGMVNATGCTSVWGSTYPFNPYPFPWTNHLFQDSASMALGIFEGHMAKMAEGFKAIRLAELEIAGRYKPAEHDEQMAYLTWQDFTDEEWELCPPVVAVGGDGAMYDIGFQNLSRAMMSGKPIKIVVVDTQVYSNTGGQACTSGFLGQVSDMAQFGRVSRGKEEQRKEIGLIGMAHRTTYVMQATAANPSHMIEGFIHGLKARRPALFNLYTACQPEHGIGDDMSTHQAKLAVESRAYPLFRYDPDRGITPRECFDLEGNPAIDQDWPTYRLAYRESGIEKEMELPMTFADFAITEVRFRKHFRKAPPDTWNDQMVPLDEFLELDEREREDRYPFIWTVDREERLSRLLVDHTMVRSCEDRRQFWTMLRALAGLDREEISLPEVEAKVRGEVISTITRNLVRIAVGEGDQVADLLSAEPVELPVVASSSGGEIAANGGNAGAEPPAGEDGAPPAVAPWIDTDLCTTCDECIHINSKIFVYNDKRKAYIADAEAGPYQDLVKAAERCTAGIIHPGVPKDRSAKDIERWIERGQKYN